MRILANKYGWPRFIATTLLLAIVLTGIADTTPGKHNAPVYDWIFIGLLIAAIRLTWRYLRRLVARRRHPDQ